MMVVVVVAVVVVITVATRAVIGTAAIDVQHGGGCC